ncbi:MAG: TIGR04255 family protein [Anditalea sp.]
MFGFNNIDHKSFNRNFLKSVTFQIKYDNNSSIETNKERIIEIFKSEYPRRRIQTNGGIEIKFDNTKTPIVQHVKEEKGVELRSEDGQKILNIIENSFSLTITGKAYKNYDGLKNDLSLLNKFLDSFQIKQINRIAIRKLNIIEFRPEDNPISILSYLMNQNLLANLSYFPNSNLINQNIQSINYKSGNFYMNLKYGLNMLPSQKPDNNSGQVIIDIDLFNLESNPTSEIFKISDVINSEIYNVFNWVISQNTINLLNNE